MPKQHETGWENINVLAPHVAALFKLLITKANVPRACKEAKLTPIHKKWQSQGTKELLRWVGHCTDFMPICYVPQSRTGVPNTTSGGKEADNGSLSNNCWNGNSPTIRWTLAKKQDAGHTIWILSWQKHAAPAVFPATPQRCSTEDAEGLITAVHSLYWFQMLQGVHTLRFETATWNQSVW